MTIEFAYVNLKFDIFLWLSQGWLKSTLSVELSIHVTDPAIVFSMLSFILVLVYGFLSV